jgi:nitrate reductase NapE component
MTLSRCDTNTPCLLYCHHPIQLSKWREKVIAKQEIKSSKRIATTVGVLFIVATVAGVLSVAFLGSVLADPNYLLNFAAKGNQIIAGALLDLVGAGAFVVLAVVIFPVLKKQNESMAIGYIIARSFEAVPFMIANLSLLSILTLSQETAGMAASKSANFLPVASGLRAMYDIAQLLGPRILASLAALPFYALLYQSKLLPRWISVWGLLGAPLYLASGLLGMSGLVDPSAPISILLFIPAALLEMVLAVWLIAKGFNSKAIDSLSAK